MRKFLGTAMGVALFSWAAVNAHADLFQNVQWFGSLDTQARGINNALDLNSKTEDFQGKVVDRLAAGVSFDVNQDASARVSLYNNYNPWGGTTGSTLTGGTGVLDQTWLGEANVTLKDILGTTDTVGRQYYNDGGDLLIRYGPTANYVVGLPVTSLDAATVNWADQGGSNKVKVMAGKVVEGTQGTYFQVTGTDVDQNVEGIEYWNTSMKQANLGARAYNFTVTDNPIFGNRDLDSSSQVVEVMAKGEPVENVHYGVQVLRDFGTSQLATSSDGGRTGIDGLGALINADWQDDVGPAKIKTMAEFGYGEGDDTSGKGVHTFQAINSDYRPGMIWGGLSALMPTGLGGFDGAGLSGANGSGLLTGNIGVKVNPAAADKLWVAAQFFDFGKASATPTPAGVPGAGSTAKGIGDELDITATWKQSENTAIRAGWAMFFPGAALHDGDNIRMESLDLILRFQ